ncbi:hypothetical protein [uncultured Roseovarius sp.]|uniref:hypothetical protein n=1 Tax=uncultured Roseovarius sp. TaxID=293344 RepID=UPI00262E2312|nr:hypothetical protein [uncultured Roseovarius sp.]
MNPRILNYIGFAVLAISTVLGFQSLWGILFLYWTIPNFYSGHAFLLSEVSRAHDPILFWLIQIAWVSIGIMLLLSDFLPGWA